MNSTADWVAFKAKTFARASLLGKTFALTIEGYRRIDEAIEQTPTEPDMSPIKVYLREMFNLPPRSQLFQCTDGTSGILLWTTTTTEAGNVLFDVQWQFATMVLAEWKAILEEFLVGCVDILLWLNPAFDKQKVRKDIFKSSAKWRSGLQKWFGIDIAPSPSPIAWTAIREWIEIRNCIVHRSRLVDKEFLDRLSDVQPLTYPYVLGKPFGILPGEIWQLFTATEKLIHAVAQKIDALLPVRIGGSPPTS